MIMPHQIWKLNTGNPGKYEEFRRLFAGHGIELEATSMDLNEIDATALEVIIHKASQIGEEILVEDTSLEVEGAYVGIHVRWFLDHLTDFVGKKAEWIVLLAYRQKNLVHIFKGSVKGSIVEPHGSTGFGFDPVFLPEGAIETLAVFKPDLFNARAKAVEALVKSDIWATSPVIEEWTGPWQS